MSGLSRRALLQATAGAAALAAVPISALSSGRAAAAAAGTTAGVPDAETAVTPAVGGGHAGPVMFCVHDAARGEVSVMHGADEVIVRDRQLVARIMQAAARRSV